MDRPKLMFASLLSFLCVLISGALVAYGSGLAFSEGAEALLVALGAAIAAYGVSSLGLLVVAWRARTRVAKKFAAYLAPAFLVLCVLGSMDVGRVSGLELGLLLLVLVIVLVNYAAVATVANYRHVA